MDDHYPAKIIDHFLTDIKVSIDDLAATIKTHNGRLSKVEKFMWAFGGAMSIMTALVLPYLFYYTTKIQEKVDNIDKTLSGYNIRVEQ